MNYEMPVKKYGSELDRVKALAIQCIATYGRLYWCRGGICGCMGCANRTMTYDEYNLALTIPEIAHLVSRQEEKQQQQRLATIERWQLHRSKSIEVTNYE